MSETRTERAKRPMLPATAASKQLGYFQLGSSQSRAAARSLATARQESEAEDGWDNELDCTGLAERLRAARKRMLQSVESGESLEEQWAPIYILPGKENTVRGRLAARLNAARARMRQYEAR
jgi:hypothetical protein